MGPWCRSFTARSIAAWWCRPATPRSGCGPLPGSRRPAREIPFANFYFGAFGNNWVDHRDEKQYREVYSFPGASLDEIAGRTFVKSMLEWNLPPVRFPRVGKPGFYASWARPALFVGGLLAPTSMRVMRVAC